MLIDNDLIRIYNGLMAIYDGLMLVYSDRMFINGALESCRYNLIAFA